jgi:hypothetical protein
MENPMESFHTSIPEFQAQLQKGSIQKAYQGIINTILGLKNDLKSKHPGWSLSSNIYQGYLDMTYFACTPPDLKDLGLKIAIVFVYQPFRFEVWLSAANKGIQQHFWEHIKAIGDHPYHLVPTVQGNDSILEYVLVDQPDFVDLQHLTHQVESGTLKFIDDVRDILFK